MYIEKRVYRYHTCKLFLLLFVALTFFAEWGSAPSFTYNLILLMAEYAPNAFLPSVFFAVARTLK